MRFVGPSPAQRAALARMQAPTPPVQGHDASDALWLLDYDVPVELWTKVAAARRRHEAAKSFGRPAGPDPMRAYPHFPEPPAEPPCPAQEEGCLAYVLEHRAEVGALLAEHRAGIDAARALAAYDGFRMGVPHSLLLEFPRLNARRPLVLADMAF